MGGLVGVDGRVLIYIPVQQSVERVGVEIGINGLLELLALIGMIESAAVF